MSLATVKRAVEKTAEAIGVDPAAVRGVAVADPQARESRAWLADTSGRRASANEPAPIDVPEGWTLWEGGQLRRLRVNKDFLQGKVQTGAWLIADVDDEGYEDAPFFVQEVRFLAASFTGVQRMEHTVMYCGREHVETEWRMFVETSGPILTRG